MPKALQSKQQSSDSFTLYKEATKALKGKKVSYNLYTIPYEGATGTILRIEIGQFIPEKLRVVIKPDSKEEFSECPEIVRYSTKEALKDPTSLISKERVLTENITSLTL